MNTKRVLIYINENKLAPTGGADGYNYTLKKGLENLNSEGIKIDYIHGKQTAKNINSRIGKIKFKAIQNCMLTIKSIVKKGLMMYGPVHKSVVDLNEYDIVHFHTTMDMYWAKDDLKDYQGKVILTLHAPTMPCKQMFSMLTDFERKYMKWFYKKLPQIDNWAIKRADYIVVACEEAEEPYYHEWPNYKNFHDKNKNKYLYMETGTEQKKYDVDRNKVREKYNIPQDAFVISYVGRHNEIKGYDSLKKIAKVILEEKEDIYFLIAGSEGPLFRLENDRWIEVGWTNDPGAIINASDLFLLPNKETYFDLILLEVLSLGQLVLATYTGGNRYFKKYNDTGIFLYKNINEAINYIYKLLNIDSAERSRLRNKNYNLYLEKFTNEAFAKRYIKMLHRVLD